MIYVQLTNGFGNNLFQANAGKILAEYNNDGLLLIEPFSGYYARKSLEKIGFLFCDKLPRLTQSISDKDYASSFSIDTKNHNVLLTGYFEDYRYFLNNREKIKQWYHHTELKTRTLAIHLRTGDRLFMKNEFYSKPTAAAYKEAIEKFDFDEVHVITDFPVWKQITPEELSSFKFHTKVSDNQRVPLIESVEYFNSLQQTISEYSPKFKKRDVLEDFNFIRSCDNILFEHGTLSWWAAFLSDAKKVGVYGPWRPWKGTTNKNLSQIPLDGWFKWK